MTFSISTFSPISSKVSTPRAAKSDKKLEEIEKQKLGESFGSDVWDFFPIQLHF